MKTAEIKVGHVYRGRRGPDRLIAQLQPVCDGADVYYYARTKDGFSAQQRRCWNVTFSDWAVEDLGEHSNAEDAARG